MKERKREVAGRSALHGERATTEGERGERERESMGERGRTERDTEKRERELDDDD